MSDRRDYHREYYRRNAQRRRKQRTESHAKNGRPHRPYPRPISRLNRWLRSPPPSQT